MIFSVFYWFGSRFDTALLIQAFIMIAMQVVLLKVSLDNRPFPSQKGEIGSTPFVGVREGDVLSKRPYGFWQWRRRRP